VTVNAASHEPESIREALWCLKGAFYYLTVPVRRLPLCRVGLHDWCGCCSPVTCRRCEISGHD
jgi:hypothetical protein